MLPQPTPTNGKPEPAELPEPADLEARARSFFDTWGVLDRLAHVQVVWNRRLRTTAGRSRPRALQIELNPQLLSRVPERIDEVLAHEAAHLATALTHGSRARHHGPEWSNLMEAVGLKPRARHDFPVEGLARVPSYYLHLCLDCGGHQITHLIREPRICRCPARSLRVFRAPRSAAGLAALRLHGG